MIVAKAVKLKHVIAVLILGSFLLHSSCDELEPLPPPVIQCSELLLQSDVEVILAQRGILEDICGLQPGEYRLARMVKPSGPIEIEVFGK
ncbi:MAG: hypothetical protein HW412_2076 [Bacteroidetes bacterium]|nr:hypothetical protein [Bacteroidota bacterium]